MALRTFSITRNGTNRDVIVGELTLNRPEGGTVSAIIRGTHGVDNSDPELPATGNAFGKSFTQAEIVAALQAIALEESIAISVPQLAALILGLPEQLIRDKFED